MTTSLIASGPFIEPVEQPTGLFFRVAFFFTKKKFGKVMGPLAVFCARMPVAFTFFYAKVGKLDKKLTISSDLVALLRLKVATTNGCLFCMDSNRAAALGRTAGSKIKMDAIDQHSGSDLFTAAELAALDFAQELTAEKEVQPETAAELRHFYDERAFCDIVWVVASEHLYNINNIGLNIGSDGFCEAIGPRKGS